MAENIELNTKINTANSAQSLGELKKSLKDLISLQGQVGDASSANFKNLQKAISETESKLGDLKDGFKTLSGSGVERLNSSLGLLKEGLVGADPEKVGIAFKGLGAAMSAIPIFLVIEGFKLLVENWDKVSAAFKSFFNIATENQKAIASLTKEIENQKKVNTALTASLENQIKILEAQGKSESSIIAKKKELVAIKIKEAEADIQLQKLKIKEIILNDSVLEFGEKKLAQYYKLTGNAIAAEAIEKKIETDKKARLTEATDALRTDLISIQNLKTDAYVTEIKQEKALEDRVKKSTDDKIAESKRLFDEIYAQEAKNQDNIDASDKADKDKADKARIEKEKAEADQKEKNDKFIVEMDARNLKRSDDELAKTKALAAAKQDAEFTIAKDGIQSLTALSDLAFSIKNANLTKGSAAEEAAARKQFAINKSLQIAGATISGIQGVLSALTAKSILPEPAGQILRVANAVAVGATTAATIAKISATQFKSSGGSASVPTASVASSSSASSSAGGGAAIPNQPVKPLNFNQSTVGQIGQPGGANTPGNNTPTNVVSVVEIARVANKVRATELQAKFG